MKCPNCDLVEPDELRNETATCPSCGATYERALRLKIRRPVQAEQKQREAELNAAKVGAARAKAEKTRRKASDKKAGTSSKPAQIFIRLDGTPAVIRPDEKLGCLRPLGLTLVLIIVTQALIKYSEYVERGKSPAKAAQHSLEQGQRPVASTVDQELSRQHDAEKQVKELLIDPFSAKFRNQEGRCGEVNSKNELGAYTGYKRYVLSTSGVILEGEPTLAYGAFDEAWKRICVP